MVLDGSSLYLSTFSVDGSTDDLQLWKLTTTGSVSWQRVLKTAGKPARSSLALDSVGDIYQINSNYQIAKYNSLGTLLWQRGVSGTLSRSSNGIDVDSNNDIHIAGDWYRDSLAQNWTFSSKLPNDGSLTGSYNIEDDSIEYQATSFTAQTSSDSSGGTPDASIFSTSETVATGTLSISSITLEQQIAS